ncbi:hypothetical protein [Halobacteriovorax sp. YZS-1-1]|uniref:hypothetical protein n=1 Tax=unclassified Halobacteriovorax TaxID=2639665 RepID=UPI00399BAD20
MKEIRLYINKKNIYKILTWLGFLLCLAIVLTMNYFLTYALFTKSLNHSYPTVVFIVLVSITGVVLSYKFRRKAFVVLVMLFNFYTFYVHSVGREDGNDERVEKDLSFIRYSNETSVYSRFIKNKYVDIKMFGGRGILEARNFKQGLLLNIVELKCDELVKNIPLCVLNRMNYVKSPVGGGFIYRNNLKQLGHEIKEYTESKVVIKEKDEDSETTLTFDKEKQTIEQVVHILKTGEKRIMTAFRESESTK